jgi:hypothetical protein
MFFSIFFTEDHLMIWDILTLLSPTIALGLFLLVRDTNRARKQRAQLGSTSSASSSCDPMEGWKVRAAASLDPAARLQPQSPLAQNTQAQDAHEHLPEVQSDTGTTYASDTPEGHRLKHTSYVPEGVRQEPPMSRG